MRLLTLELNGVPKILIHILGITLLVGRILHSGKGFPEKSVGYADNDLSVDRLGYIEHSILGVCRGLKF